MFLSEFSHNVHADNKLQFDVLESVIEKATKEYVEYLNVYIERQISKGMLCIMKEMVRGGFHNVLIDRPVVETQKLHGGIKKTIVKIPYKLIAASGTQQDLINTWRSKGIQYGGQDPYEYPYDLFKKEETNGQM